MSDMINVAVLGPIPRDNITSYQGETRNGDMASSWWCEGWVSHVRSVLRSTLPTLLQVSLCRQRDPNTAP